MIRRSTWITLVVFVIIVVFAVYWTKSGSEQMGQEPTAIPESPWSLDFADIERVTINDQVRGESLELHRLSEGNWEELKPESGPVDAARVEQALYWLKSPYVNRSITTEGGLAQFGLDTPRAIITIGSKDGNDYIMLIGDKSPVGNTTYAIIPHTYEVLLLSNYDVNSVLDLVGIELLIVPQSEEDPPDLEPQDQ